ncbi:hypothetical protein Aperf_G00000130603 [Anoplocephala perfoliata]
MEKQTEISPSRNQEQPQSDIDDNQPIPLSLVLKIFLHSKLDGVLKCRQVSRAWRDLANYEGIWGNFCGRKRIPRCLPYIHGLSSSSKSTFECNDPSHTYQLACLRHIQTINKWRGNSEFGSKILDFEAFSESNPLLMYMMTFGEWVLCGSRFNKIIIYDCNGRGRFVGVIRGPQGIAEKFVVMKVKEYSLLVAKTMTDKICVYNLNQQDFPLEGELHGHTDVILDIAASTSYQDPLNPDSRGLLVSSARDLTVRVWDVAERTCIRVFDGLAEVAVGVAFCSDYVVALENGQYLRVWSLLKDSLMFRELLTIRDPWIRKFDGSRIMFHRNTESFVYDIFQNRYVGGVVVSSTPFTVVDNELICVCEDGAVQHDLLTGKREIIPNENRCKANDLKAIYANQRFIFTFESRRVQLWDRDTAVWVRTLLDIENVPGLEKFGNLDPPGVVATESFRHLIVPVVKQSGKDLTLLVLALKDN